MTASKSVEIKHRTDGSVFDDVALFPPEGVTQARVSDIKHGKINQFSLAA